MIFCVLKVITQMSFEGDYSPFSFGKSWLEDGISFWNGPFLWDMLIFGTVFCGAEDGYRDHYPFVGGCKSRIILGNHLFVHCLEGYQYNEPFFESYTGQRLRIAYNI